MIRCDDVGMCHGVNTAVRELAATGLPFSTSVMFACPWYREAVEILADHPEIGVGVHLTLNSEWEHYKWGPVLGAARVPSLVDANGHFHPSEAAFAAARPDLEEVRAELEPDRAGARVGLAHRLHRLPHADRCLDARAAGDRRAAAASTGSGSRYLASARSRCGTSRPGESCRG
jgi:hypothetical protein